MAICKNCGKEFEAKRSTAKYCSAKCRKVAFLSVPEEQPINVTLKNGKMEILTKEPDLIAAIQESPAAWVESRDIKLANGDIYSFADRPYLIRPMGSQARLKCVIKATQLGFSETFIQESLWGCIVGKYRQGVAYIFPNDTEMKTFVQSRVYTFIRGKTPVIGR